MTVKVCDAICGAGKTQSCINMINNDIYNKYIFITPYLDEVERIKTSCAFRGFLSPERSPVNNYSKLNDICSLLRKGENIASTHALFSTYTEEIKQLIQEQEYILILDEVIDLFQPVKMDGGDVQFLVRNNIAKKENDEVIWGDEEYTGVLFSEVMRVAKSRNLIDYDGAFYFWALPIDVFKCFKEVYVLTYMFEYQMLKYFFDINGIKYNLIGTKRENGVYQFCPLGEMDRKRELKAKIHINNSSRANEVGNSQYALSSGWFDREVKREGQPSLTGLKNSLKNTFRHYNARSDDVMWTTLNKYKNYLKGKGYTKGFITFNKRATNSFAGKHYLAYCLNVYMMPWMKNYLLRMGAKEVNQDMYALSVLIQWIFRSAIRKGEDVWIYIPSKRMRYMLTKWLDNLEEGNDLREIKYKAREALPKNEIGYAVWSAVKNKKEGKK